MRLYTNRLGQWYGTQADAKRSGNDWVEVDVPTVKADLLDFLNSNEAGRVVWDHEGGSGSTGTHKPIVAPYDPDAPVNQTPEEIQKIYPQGRPHPWTTIRECAEQASLKDLSVALAVFLNRYEEELS